MSDERTALVQVTAEYTANVNRLAAGDFSHVTTAHHHLVHAGLGMLTELFELAEAVDAVNETGALEELGDLLFFMTLAGEHIADESHLELHRIPGGDDPEYVMMTLVIAFLDECKRRFAYNKPKYHLGHYLGQMEEQWRGIVEGAELMVKGGFHETYGSWTDTAIMQANMRKLGVRHSNGYSNDDAVNRDTAAEMAALTNR